MTTQLNTVYMIEGQGERYFTCIGKDHQTSTVTMKSLDQEGKIIHCKMNDLTEVNSLNG